MSKKLAIIKHYGLKHQLSKLSEACVKLSYACLKNDKEYIKRKIANVQFLLKQIIEFENLGVEIYKREYELEDELYFEIYPDRKIENE